MAFKRYLFSARQTAGSIKSLLVKLQAGGSDLVEHVGQGASYNGLGRDSDCFQGGRITYEELQQFIEELCRETGFYEALREEVT